MPVQLLFVATVRQKFRPARWGISGGTSASCDPGALQCRCATRTSDWVLPLPLGKPPYARLPTPVTGRFMPKVRSEGDLLPGRVTRHQVHLKLITATLPAAADTQSHNHTPISEPAL